MTQRTGGARFPSTKYKTSQHCVAYLDFLGGTDIILHDDQDKHLNIINMIFEDALNESKMITNDIFVKIFSGFGTKNGTVNKGKSIIAGIGEPEKWL